MIQKDANVTWKQLGVLVGIVTVFWLAGLGLQAQLFYSSTSAATLEQRVSTTERDLSELKDAMARQELNQREIMQNQLVIINLLRETR